MPIFRRGPGRDPADGALGGLGLEELLRRYRAVDLDADPADPSASAARAVEADRLAAEVLRRHPGDSAFWYDRGMFAKWRRDWEACSAHNRESLRLIPPEARTQEPAAWNLGIASTALSDWRTARRGWRAFGIQLPDAADDAPIEADFGIGAVRLNPEPRFVGEPEAVVSGAQWDTEVVWGERVCPARIRILSVPLPASGHRWGDVVLHDGDPVGSRRLGEREVSVFNEIWLWSRSAVPTSSVRVEAPSPPDVAELIAVLDSAGVAAEDWTGSVQLLCRACSEGAPDGSHRHGAADGWSPTRHLGLAGDSTTTGQLLRRWADAAPNRSYGDVQLELA